MALTLLNPNICAHIIDTHNTFLWIYKRNISTRCIAEFVGGANNSTTCENLTLADLDFTNLSPPP